MFIGLLGGNKYKIYNTLGELKKDPSVEYVISDTSTLLKGDVFTIIDIKDIPNEGDEANADFKLLVGSYFTDFLDENLSMTLNPKGIGVFNIYQTISQMINLDNFNDESYAYQLSYIFKDVNISYKDKHIHIDPEMGDMEIKKAFNKAKLGTRVNKLLYNKFIIFYKKGVYEITDREPRKKFKYIGVPINDAESLYILTRETYENFKKIAIMDITLTIKDPYDDGEDTDLDGSYFYGESQPTINELLEMCLYIPQIVTTCEVLGGVSYDINVFLKLDNGNTLESVIPWHNSPQGVCLFNTINQMVIYMRKE